MSNDKEGKVFLPFALSLLPFLLLATANSAGYRYGASDLAFYGPAVMRALDPELFPRDGPVIDAQARLTLMDETVAGVARLTTTDLPALFLGLYLLTLALLALAVSAIGARIYRGRWAVAALTAALTLRHAVAKSGTNTLEGYFHPRQLAFAFGALAVAAFLRGRPASAALALGGAALLHPTTTLWFAIWLAVAALASARRHPGALAAAAACAVAAAGWAAWFGPLAGRLTIMDAEWLDAVAAKDYLFPLDWPTPVWMLNLGYAPLIWWLYRRRAAAGLAVPREREVVIGCLSLVAVFLAAVALNATRVALAIQLQPARIFWMLDLLAVVYVVWALAEGVGGSERRARAAAVALAAVSAVRGGYVMGAEFPDRPLFEPAPPGDWGLAARWAQSTPRGTGWLADPAHASTYGTSWRMAARRDVLVEAAKDAAIGMYDRGIALRTRDRLRAVGDFNQLSPADARRLASEYDLDYLITEAAMELPVAFEAGAIHVYRLR